MYFPVFPLALFKPKAQNIVMKKFKAWRYKCDFCGKNGYSAGHMRSHETGCTANPNRVCKIHQYADLRRDRPGPLPVASLVVELQQHRNDEDRGISALRELAEDCPCCMLAAIRQSGLGKGYADEDGYDPPWIGKEQFNFKEELARLWANKNEAEDMARHDY